MRQERTIRMSQHEAGLRCWAMYGATICPMCSGSGIVASSSWHGRALKGGLKSYLASLKPGVLSMRERGKLGGRPRALTIENLNERRETAPDSRESRGLPLYENDTPVGDISAIRR